MIKLGITGTTTFENRRKIKNMIFTIRQNLGDEVIFVGVGDKAGADKHIRKYVLELECRYQEANLPHTSPTLYSIMHENFYGTLRTSSYATAHLLGMLIGWLYLMTLKAWIERLSTYLRQ